MTSHGFACLEFEHRDAIALIGLREPATRNAISEAMRDELLEACAVVEAHPDMRAVVLYGAGDVFSSGANLREFGRATSVVEARRARGARNAYRRVLMLPLPTVAAMATVAVGGGLELALCCDVRVAAVGTRLGLPEVRRGFIPGGGGTQLVARRAGVRPADRLVLEGALIGAEEARRLGLVHEICPSPEAALARAVELANDLAEADPAAVAHVKRVLLAAS